MQPMRPAMQRLPGGDAIEEPGGELIARAGGIHRLDRSTGTRPSAPSRRTTSWPERVQTTSPQIVRRLFQGGAQIVGLIERQPFVLIADHVIQFAQSGAEIGAVAVDAERIGQRDAHAAPARAAVIGGGA